MHVCRVWTEGRSPGQLLPEPHPQSRSSHRRGAQHAIPEFEYLLAPVLHGGGFDFFRGFGGEAIPPIFGDCPIDDCSAVDAFPGIEGQKKV